MSTTMRTYSSGSSATSKQRVRITQTTADAKLQAVFEEANEAGDSFDYTETIKAIKPTGERVPIAAHLQRIQRGGLTQTFGCMVAVEESSFKVLAYSENAPEMLDLTPEGGLSVGRQDALGLGTDARNLFNSGSAAALERAAGASDASMFNPILVHCKSSEKPFYAIVHRVDEGLLFDLEPVRPSDPLVSAEGVLQSHKLGAKAIAKLQSLPVGDLRLLCDTVVEEVRELTGYDRVMAYKFHEDEHGEVVAESLRSDLEPYLGLHYPATDIPQASRLLFLKNRVRMICDCYATPAKVIQAKDLRQSLSLADCTLRAPYGCHAQYMGNMGSVASLVLAVIINDNDDDYRKRGYQEKGRLWGLVVCHHTTERFVPFPLRSACEFLMLVFGLQLNMEVNVAAQLREKHVLRTQTLLCDMLLRHGPIGIVSQSPSIMDLVKCDGAAIYDGKRYRFLGTSPTESQIMDIGNWLLENHKGSSGLITDSLTDAGYPDAASLGDAVCGLAAAKITRKHFLYWFRSQTAKEIKWGGAKHDKDDTDDDRMMHPRSSFKVFMEVVNRRSLPWADVEMDAIDSLQLILQDSFQDTDDIDTESTIHSGLDDLSLQGIDELSTVAKEMIKFIETASAPILAVDSNGFVNGWNAKVAELTGLPATEALGRSLTKDLILDESKESMEGLLHLVLQGEEEENVEIKFRTFGVQKEKGAVVLIVNAYSSRDEKQTVVGVCFVGQDVTPQKEVVDKSTHIQGDDEAIVQNPSLPIPPIFGVDEFGCCSEWNSAMENMSGWKREEVFGKLLMGEVFGLQMSCCRIKGKNAMTEFRIVLSTAIDGQVSEKFPFAFIDRQENYVEAHLTTKMIKDSLGSITGVLCFLHIASVKLQ